MEFDATFIRENILWALLRTADHTVFLRQQNILFSMTVTTFE